MLMFEMGRVGPVVTRVCCRSVLLHGIASTALLIVPMRAAAAPPTPFSQAWLGQRPVQPGTAAAPASAPLAGLSANQQRQIATSKANFERAATALRTVRMMQESARTAAATTARPDQRTVGNGIAKNGLYYAQGAAAGDSYDVTTKAARAGSAPDGLVWSGADLPVAKADSDVEGTDKSRFVPVAKSGNTLVTVRQTASKAVLTWQNFDVGADTTLYFQQTTPDGAPQRDWVVLNRIVGQPPAADGSRPQLAPSLILGRIRGEGEAYVINQNGIIFGAGSQTNLNSLVASSLDVGLPYQTLAQRNLYFTSNVSGRNAFSFQYLFETDAARAELYGPLKLEFTDLLSFSNNQPFEGQRLLRYQYLTRPIEAPREGDVVVEAGATITSGSLNAKDRALGLNPGNTLLPRVVLAGPLVRNAGIVEADDGQVAVVGARNFSLYTNDGNSGRPIDPANRGAIIESGQQDWLAERPTGAASANLRPDPFIAVSLQKTIFGSIGEGRFRNQEDRSEIVIGIAQGGNNVDRLKLRQFSNEDAQAFQIQTDAQGRRFIVRRAFDLRLDSAAADAGTVINDGLLSAPRGGITIRSNAITQAGIVHATTSVNQAGLIDIGAASISGVVREPGQDFFGNPILISRVINTLGSITIAPTSVITVMPDAQVQADGKLKTIPSDATSLGSFEASQVRIGTRNILGDYLNLINPSRVTGVTEGSVSLAAGSLLVAPGANVELSAGSAAQLIFVDSYTGPGNRPVDNGDLGLTIDIVQAFAPGLVIAGATGDSPGAILDVAGLTDVVLPMASNLVTVGRVGQNELADVPEQRDGFIYRKTVGVDRRLSGTRDDGFQWRGTPLFDASGYIDARPQLVTELMTDGGTLNLAGGVVVGKGALLNIAGGYLRFEDGVVDTPDLATADGKRSVNIGRANPAFDYVSFSNNFVDSHPRWGQDFVYADAGALASPQSKFEASYIEGGNAGAIILKPTRQISPLRVSNVPSVGADEAAALLVFEGTINAGAVTGPYQRAGSAYYQASNPAPRGGRLDLSATLATDISFANDAQIAALRAANPDAFLAADYAPGDLVETRIFRNQVWSTEALSQTGLADLRFGGTGLKSFLTEGFSGIPRLVASTESVSLAAGATLALPDGAKLTLTGRNISLDGAITAHGGSVDAQLLSGPINRSDVINNPNDPRITFDPTTALLPRSNFRLGAGASIDLSGRWNNDTVARRDTFEGSSFVDGGSLSVTSDALLNTVEFAKGSRVDLTSGGNVRPRGRLATSGPGGLGLGRGGNLTISLGNAPERGGYVPVSPETDLQLNPGALREDVREEIASTLVFDGDVEAFGFQGGGRLTLAVPALRITDSAPSLAGGTGMILVDPALFTDLGFGDIRLTALLTASIDPGLKIALSQRQWLLNEGFATAASVREAASPGQYAANTLQRTPVDFSLTGLGYTDFNSHGRLDFDQSSAPYIVRLASSFTADHALIIGDGVDIIGDAGADIALAATGQLSLARPVDGVGGKIEARGGSVTIEQRFGILTTKVVDAYYNGFDDPRSESLTSVNTGFLPSDARINVDGVFLADGRKLPRSGTLLDGGTITLDGGIGIDAAEGVVIAQAGSRLDASGTSAIIDLPVQGLVSVLQPVTIASAGGRIVTRGAVLRSDLHADAGAANVAGGTLDATISRVTASAASGLDGFVPVGRPDDPTIAAIAGEPFSLSTTRLADSGIDAVVLRGPGDVIGFAAGVDLDLDRSLIVDATRITRSGGATALSGGDLVRLSAPLVKLQSGNQSIIVGPSLASVPASADDVVRLEVEAGLIEISDVHFITGFNSTLLDSETDIRFVPEIVTRLQTGPVQNLFSTGPGYSVDLYTNSDLTLRAQQVYPSTGVRARLFARDFRAPRPTITVADFTLRIEQAPGIAATPLSAGGSVLLSAATVVQAGTLRAPLGEIRIGESIIQEGTTIALTKSAQFAPGSITSVSADGLAIPFGQTRNGIDWLYLGLGADPLAAAPAKAIRVVAERAVLAGATSDAPAALLDFGGGGDVFATEFIPGLGGQRNILSTSLSVDRTAAIYAILPGVQPRAAPIDPEGYTNLATDVPGRTLTLFAPAGDLPAGTYTLYPGAYAVLPGAYRVQAVAASPATLPADTAGTLVDGSQIVSGSLGIAGTAIQETLPTAYRIHAPGVWERYSQIATTKGNTFFAKLATDAGVAPAPLPVDAGLFSLALTATDRALITGARFDFSLGDKGRGGQVDIATDKIAVVSAELREGLADELADYLVLTPQDVAGFNATSLLLGATRTSGFEGVTLTPIASQIRIATTAGDPLANPELLLLTGELPDLRSETGISSRENGISIDAGSNILARGESPGGAAAGLIIGVRQPANSTTPRPGNVALVRVSTANAVTIDRAEANAPFTGTVTIASDPDRPTTIDGGSALEVNAAANVLLDPSTILGGASIDLFSRRISFASAADPDGTVIGVETLRLLGNARSITFRAQQELIVDEPLRIGAGAGAPRLEVLRFSTPLLVARGFEGGALALDAVSIALINDFADVVAPVPAADQSGRLLVTADRLTLGGNDRTLDGFDLFDFTIADRSDFGGTLGDGVLTLPGSATFTTPSIVLVASGSDESLVVTGNLALLGGAAASSAAGSGGRLRVEAGNGLVIDTRIAARGGVFEARALAGDLTLGENAAISAGGFSTVFRDRTVVYGGGTVRLTADTGNISAAAASVIDVAADRGGIGGAVDLVLGSAEGTLALEGALRGAGGGDGLAGSQFGLDTAGSVELDPLVVKLVASGFDRGIAVRAGRGNLDLSTPLTSAELALTADDMAPGSGIVRIATTVDASGAEGGRISLYGQRGVTLTDTAWLIATARGPVVDDRGGRGGTVDIGVGVLSPDDVEQAAGGAIRVAAGARIDVADARDAAGNSLYRASRGGDGAAVVLRAPIIDRGVDIAFAGTISGARTVAIEGYRRFTTQNSAFDGIVDPAGWFDANGRYVDGTWTDSFGGVLPPGDVQKGIDNPENFTGASFFDTYTVDPLTGVRTATANQQHVEFYQATLRDFARDPGVDAAGLPVIAGARFRPGIELVNSDPGRLGGDIQVLSNWNLGAGASIDDLDYRTTADGQPGVLTLRAIGNVDVKASISDGFYREDSYNPFAEFAAPSALEAWDTYNFFAATVLQRPRRNDFFGLKLTAPSDLRASIYYRNYDLYVKRLYLPYSNFFNAPGGPPALEALGPGLSAAVDYEAYSIRYRNYLEVELDRVNADPRRTQNFTRYFRAIAPVQPSDDANYGTYAALYGAYLRSIYDFNIDPVLSQFGQAQPQAPRVPLGTPLDRGYAELLEPVANRIDNNPTAFDQLPVSSAKLGISGDSWSYRFVAGSRTSSGDAMATRIASADPSDFRFSDDTQTEALLSGPRDIVRTGTGSITIAANGDARWAGANSTIYTAGIDNGYEPGFVDVNLPSETIRPGIDNNLDALNGVALTGGVFPKRGGDIRIAVGGSFIGAPLSGDRLSPFRAPVAALDGTDGLVINNAGLGIYQIFTTPNITLDLWLFQQGISSSTPQVFGQFGGESTREKTFGREAQAVPNLQSAQWVSTGRVGGTVEALGGGNISIDAGRDVTNLSAYVVGTLQVSGGKTQGAATSLARFGGGDISVTAGGDVAGVSLFTSRGAIDVVSGGAITTRQEDFLTVADFSEFESNARTFDSLTAAERASVLVPAAPNVALRGSLFSVQNGTIKAVSRAGITIETLNREAPRDLGIRNLEGEVNTLLFPVPNRPFSELGTFSSASFMTASGDISYGAVRPQLEGQFFFAPVPGAFELVALRGSLDINGGIRLAPSPRGDLQLLADDSIRYSYPNLQFQRFTPDPTLGDDYRTGVQIGMDDRDPAIVATPLAPEAGTGRGALDRFELHQSGKPLHFDNPDPARIIANTGDIVTGRGLATDPVAGAQVGRITSISLAKPATIFAGRDIIDMRFFGQNVRDTSLTSITAGRDITFTLVPGTALNRSALPIPGGSNFVIGGPGRMTLTAGRSIDLAPTLPTRRFVTGGIAPEQAQGLLSVANAINPFLPEDSADLSVSFGVGPTIGLPGDADVAAFVARYIDPAAPAERIQNYDKALAAFVNERLTKAAQEENPGTDFVADLSVAQAWEAFEAMPADVQRPFVDDVFFNELRIIADPSNLAQYQNFPRASRAIETLFPAASGYTDNFTAPFTRVPTGNLDMVSSLIRTSYGGDINIFGPGGNAIIGGLAIDARQQGIVTLRGGEVNLFLDGNLAVNSSRIFTLQGGNLSIISSNGNIDAGRGRKTSSFLPPLVVSYLTNTASTVDFGGLVTGAGIGTLQTLPSVDSADVFLLAPRGDIDAGDAGIRSSRDLFILAVRVLNADNIQVAGRTVGIPQAPTIATSSLTTASNAAASVAASAADTTRRSADPQPVVTVQVTGFSDRDIENRRRSGTKP